MRFFLLTLPIYVLAVARLARLAVADVIFERPRSALWNWLAEHRHPQLLYLASCRWCLSVWISLPVMVTSYYLGRHPWVLIPAAALAASHVTGHLAGAEDRNAEVAELATAQRKALERNGEET